MNISLTITEKAIELDEFLNEEEMELPPFQFALVELSQYVNGFIKISFGQHKSITLDLFSDFLVCFDDILDSITSSKLLHLEKEEIWFCEQGSDFYLCYEVKNDLITLSYIKGQSVGVANKNIPNFSVEVNTVEYIREWENLFQKLSIILEEKLHKKTTIPFNFQ